MPTKRSYTLGKRAISAARTRQRIIEAAAELYKEQGIRATTMKQVAREAGVSPGTVLNHFPEVDLLAEAVAKHLTAPVPLPSRQIFEGAEDAEARLPILIKRLYQYWESVEPWAPMHEREHHVVPALERGQARVDAALRRLMMVALGPLARDKELWAVVAATIGSGFRRALRASGVSEQQAVALATRVVVQALDHARSHEALEPDESEDESRRDTAVGE